MVPTPPTLPELRRPLTVRHKVTGRALLRVPIPESLACLRATVDYGGDELVIPHLCYEMVEHTDLGGADLRGLFLYGAVLSRVDLAGADLTGAHLRDTVFLGCTNLDRAVGLDRVEHDGPSCLDAGRCGPARRPCRTPSCWAAGTPPRRSGRGAGCIRLPVRAPPSASADPGWGRHFPIWPSLRRRPGRTSRCR